MSKTLGDLIKLHRKSLRLNQMDYGKLYGGVSHAAVSDWERGISKPNGLVIEEVLNFSTRVAEQRLIEKVQELLHNKSELVTYKKDGGHGVAVPMSVVFDLDQLAGEEGKDE